MGAVLKLQYLKTHWTLLKPVNIKIKKISGHFVFILSVYLPSLYFLTGNALALAVLSHDRSKSATSLSLKALALSDLVLLISAFAQQVKYGI